METERLAESLDQEVVHYLQESQRLPLKTAVEIKKLRQTLLAMDEAAVTFKMMKEVGQKLTSVYKELIGKAGQ